MTHIRNWIYVWLVLMGLWACEERIELDIEQVPDGFVIDGLLTNQFKQHYVRVKKMVDFYDTARTPDVKNARVVVLDNLGNVYDYLGALVVQRDRIVPS